ncbi:MAG: single-stranded-DNA-specific exonuclease RecJ, partial [Candidatus Omnitrophica bacterium]|nr:single-stranded-DNA-specific exonuclease RecJ [Candidatus Omnitrophota bacterium]
ISMKDNVGKGSGRSVRNFHLFDTLSKCGHLLEEFGGHEKAAGLSIIEKNVVDFKRFFNEMAHKSLTLEDLVPVVDIDMEVTLGALSEKLILEIEQCAPFGNANPRPVFVSHGLQIKSKPKMLKGSSFKFWLTDGKTTCEALGNNNNGLDISHIDDGFSIVYSPSLHTWDGISTIQLKVKDLRCC